jgi:hypothetical protein
MVKINQILVVTTIMTMKKRRKKKKISEMRMLMQMVLTSMI